MSEQKTIDSQYMLSADGRASLNIDGPGSMVKELDHDHNATLPTVVESNAPTAEEKLTLRKVAGKLPYIAYMICLVEFAERASYYGVQPLFSQFVNRPLPKNGNGYGAPARGSTNTAGALGWGSVKASAVTQSFSMVTYALPVFFGWLADAKYGRFKLICWGVAVCGVSHILMCAAGAPTLLASGMAKVPFLISVYMLAVGAAMFKPNISPTLLDQMKNQTPVVTTLKSGERVIIDPEATTERVMLWFYMLVNVGGFMNVPTTYTEKYVGWWLSFVLPLILYLPLPFMLWYLKPKMILYPPGGSDLGNVFKILGICFKNGGLKLMFSRRSGFFEPAKPSVMRAKGLEANVPWNDEFVSDVRRTFQACGIFLFFPFQAINDTGLGSSAGVMSAALIAKGVPNDVIGNFNSLTIIVAAPILNYGLYPLLRRKNIHYGPIARITTGLLLAITGGAGYALISWKTYQLSPCGNSATSLSCVDDQDNSILAPITVWWMAIPYSLGGLSELFVNVPAFGIAYSRAPKNMRGLLAALNLFTQAITYAIALASAAVITDPYLTWVFAGPAVIAIPVTAIFWWLYHDIDNEEYKLTNATGNYTQDSDVGAKMIEDKGSETQGDIVNEKKM